MTNNVSRNLKSMATSRTNDVFTGVDVAVDSACTGMKLRREDSVTTLPQNHSFIDVGNCCYFYPRDADFFFIQDFMRGCNDLQPLDLSSGAG
jgi:hypothetical protein